MLKSIVEQSPTRAQLLEALSRLRKSPECATAHAYADLLLALETKRQEEPSAPRPRYGAGFR